jgi:hypothetical protein
MPQIILVAPERAPEEVTGLRFWTLATVTMLTWLPVFRYADGQEMDEADQKQLRYRVLVGSTRNQMASVIDGLSETWIALEAVPYLTPGQFVAVTAYIPQRSGPRSKPECWQVRRRADTPEAVNEDNPGLEIDPCDDSR